jgi:hypothetical protein
MLAILKRLKMPRIDVSLPAGASITVQDLLSDDESFRSELREHMQGRLSQLVAEVRAFAGEIAR